MAKKVGEGRGRRVREYAEQVFKMTAEAATGGDMMSSSLM